MRPFLSTLERRTAEYPGLLEVFLGDEAPPRIQAVGSLEILLTKKVAIFASRNCPGPLASLTYDAMQHLRDAGLTAAGGFHSPMEKHCLEILLRSPHPVILAAARSLDAYRVPRAYRRPLDERRLLILSPFPDSAGRVSADSARHRNRFLAALSDAVFVPYAEEQSATLDLCREILGWGKRVATLDHPRNQRLLSLGIAGLTPSQLPGVI